MIVRKRLLRRISAIRPSLVYLCAPAGSGKSTLLAQMTSAIVFDASRPDANATLRAWLDDGSHSSGVTLAVDSAEYLEADLAARIADHADAEHPAIFASREPVFATGTLPPHELLTLSSTDLWFDRTELSELLGLEPDTPTLETIASATCGWPLAVRFAQRLARTREVTEEALLDIRDRDTRDLRRYLEHQVLRSLDRTERATLLTISAIDDFSTYDAAAYAASDERRGAVSYLERIGLVLRDDESLQVPPILASIVADRTDANVREEMQSLAELVANQGRTLRAIELFVRAGSYDSALALYQHARSHSDRRYVLAQQEQLLQIPLLDICRDFSLWLALLNRFLTLPSDHPIRRDAALLASEPTLEPRTRAVVLLTAALFALDDSQLGFARRLSLAARAVIEDEDVTAVADALTALIAAKDGDALAARAAYPHEQVARLQLNETLAPITYLIDIRVAAHRPDDERLWTELRTRYRNICATVDSHLALRLTHSTALVGWALNNEPMLRFALDHFEALALNGNEQARSYRRLFVGGERPERAQFPRQQFYDIAIALSQTPDDDEATRATLLAEAADIVRSCDEAPLTHAYGVLTASMIGGAPATEVPPWPVFVRANVAPESTRRATLCVAENTVRSATGESVTLPDRAVQLLVFLAERGGSALRIELLDELWSELSDASQNNALKSCVHRTRAALVPFGATIVSIAGGYELQGLDVDITDAVRRVAQALDRAEDSGADVALAARVLAAGLPEHLERRQCFDRLRGSMENLGEMAWRAIGEAALAARDTARLSEAVEALLRLDSCNESAFALILKERLQAGDREGAVSEYRRYSRLLRDELSTSPSTALRHLIAL